MISSQLNDWHILSISHETIDANILHVNGCQEKVNPLDFSAIGGRGVKNLAVLTEKGTLFLHIM